MLYAVLTPIAIAGAILSLLPALLERNLRAAFAVACIPALALGIYHFSGSADIVWRLEKQAQEDAGLALHETQLLEALQTVPDEPSLWVRLGTTRMQLKKYAEASQAYKKAVLLSNGQPTILMAYGKSLVLAADQKVGKEAKKAFEMVLLQEKENAEAEYFLGLERMQQADRTAALAIFEKLVRTQPAESPVGMRAKKHINDLKNQP